MIESPKLALVTCSLLAALACPHVVHAQANGRDPTGARAHYDQGRALYLQGHFLDAAREFRAAYEATLEPAFLYNAAMALYDGGELSGARDAFRAYLREQPNTPNRAVIEQRVATIDRRLQETRVSSASPSAVGERTSTARRDETVRSPLAWAGLAVGIAGVVSLGVGAGLYVSVDATYRRCLPNLCDPSEQPRAFDAASIAMLWGGGALAIAGTALFLFVPRVRVHATETSFGLDPRGGAFVTIHF